MSLPQIAQLDIEISAIVTPETVHTTFDWDFATGDFRLRDGSVVSLVGVDYLKVWIQKALRTVKDTLIYKDTDYGSEHHSLIGQNFNPDYSQSEYERMIRECLLQNDAISSVEGFLFTQSGSRLVIDFDVGSIYGLLREDVVI